MKLLHLDIETAPNLGHIWGLFKQNIGINQLIESSYTMCWAAKWHGTREVLYSGLHTDTAEDMIKKVHSLLDEADAVIHYNGTKFDIPTLNKEFLLYGMAPPSPYKQIDLLQIARKQFRFPSNKLDYVANALGLGGKVAHEGHTLWVKCMNDDPVAWKKMQRYNIQDVKLLEKVYKKLLPWIYNHPNHAMYGDADRPTCTNCGSHKVQSRGTETTRTQKYRRYQCTGCGTWLRGRSTQTTKEERPNILIQAR